jgi:hypothetical protein
MPVRSDSNEEPRRTVLSHPRLGALRVLEDRVTPVAGPAKRSVEVARQGVTVRSHPRSGDAERDTVLANRNIGSRCDATAQIA